MNNRVTTVFRRRDNWLYDCIDKIVRVKRAAGIKTSHSYELVRLAKDGLTHHMHGAENDLSILKKGVVDALPQELL